MYVVLDTSQIKKHIHLSERVNLRTFSNSRSFVVKINTYCGGSGSR